MNRKDYELVRDKFMREELVIMSYNKESGTVNMYYGIRGNAPTYDIQCGVVDRAIASLRGNKITCIEFVDLARLFANCTLKQIYDMIKCTDDLFNAVKKYDVGTENIYVYKIGSGRIGADLIV
jgi:hypothetical protein